MTYLVIALLFGYLGFKLRGVIDTYRMVKDKKYIEKVVNKLFEPTPEKGEQGQ